MNAANNQRMHDELRMVRPSGVVDLVFRRRVILTVTR